MPLVNGRYKTYEPGEELEEMKKAEAKFKNCVTEMAGKEGLKARVKKQLDRNEYNFTRFLTGEKEFPKAKAVEAAVLKKMGNQR
jgi:hypothetical protein